MVGKGIGLIETYKKGRFLTGKAFSDNTEKAYKTPEIKTWMITPLSILRTEKIQIDPAINIHLYDFLRYPDFGIPNLQYKK